MFKGIAGAVAAFSLVPNVANAVEGESPRTSFFGMFGDPGAYSESTAYGLDQEDKLYSPYSVYSARDKDTLYVEDAPQYRARKDKVIDETKVRLGRLPAYIEKKRWMEVSNELRRYMYETRGAVMYLTETDEARKAADDFFEALEEISGAAYYKKQAACAAAVPKAQAKLEALEKLI